MEGWIKLHRKFLDWEWFQVSDMIKLFIFLLLNANHNDNFWRGIEIKRGQYVTGLKSLSIKTNISEQSLRTYLQRLEKTGEINRQSTNKYSIITICNYDSYQENEKTTNKQTNKQLTNNQQTTNNKQELKNENNKFIYNEFYDTQIELSGNDKFYLLFVKWLFGENMFKEPLKNVLKLKQISWVQFPEVLKIHEETKVNIRPLLEEMDNWLTTKKGQERKTLIGVLKTFAENKKLKQPLTK